MKTLLLFTATIAIYCLGCTSKEHTNDNASITIKNKEQVQFESFVTSSCLEYDTAANDVQKDEIYTKFGAFILKIRDSLGVMHDWQGVVKTISPGTSIIDSISTVAIEIEVAYNTNSFMKFVSTSYFNKNRLDSNILYQHIKNLKPGTTVYFDGFIGIVPNGEISVDFGDNDGDRKICSPAWNFYLVALSTDKLNILNSNGMKRAIDIEWQSFKMMQDMVNDKITDATLKKNLHELKVELDPITAKFTTKEMAYIQCLIDCLTKQFYLVTTK